LKQVDIFINIQQDKWKWKCL